MITLQPIRETNFLQAAALQISPAQRSFVSSPVGILARAYAYRRRRATAWGIYEGCRMVGLALVQDLEEAPACYHLSEFLIDEREQGKGYGREALKLLLAQCRREGKYQAVEVCVKKADSPAVHVYEKAGFRDTGYTDPTAPDSLCMTYAIPEAWRGALDIHLTQAADLAQIQRLWATPSVMRYVGFPEGLHKTMEELQERWLPWVQQPPRRQHWSVYTQEGDFCGEAFYGIDETGLACMDVKLLDSARGKGIGYRALSHALDAAFWVGAARKAYVDPNPQNGKALCLYADLGFLPAARPARLEPEDSVYLELTRENWEARQWK